MSMTAPAPSTAGKWHISPEIGPARCSAKIACRFGDAEHYDSQLDAFKAYESMNPVVMESFSRKTLVSMGYFDDKAPEEVAAILKSDGRPDGTGSIEDPISLANYPDNPKGERVKQAVRLLAAGKHIRMSSNREYSTMIYKLHEIMEEEGLVERDDDGNPRMTPFGPKYMPINIGLCAVKGTNIFCGETIGVDRVRMPQTAGKPQPNTKGARLPADRFNEHGEINLSQEYQDELKALGIDVELKEGVAAPNPVELKASQNEIDGAKVRGMVNALANGGKIKPSVITTDGYVVDGHHGWAAVAMYNQLVKAGSLPGPEKKLPVVEIDLEIGATLDYTNDFCKRWGIASAGM